MQALRKMAVGVEDHPNKKSPARLESLALPALSVTCPACPERKLALSMSKGAKPRGSKGANRREPGTDALSIRKTSSFRTSYATVFSAPAGPLNGSTRLRLFGSSLRPTGPSSFAGDLTALFGCELLGSRLSAQTAKVDGMGILFFLFRHLCLHTLSRPRAKNQQNT